MSTAVRIDNLLCAAQGRALLQIDRLQIRQGERIAIVGPNGAGKSTLLRVLSGLMRPEHGRVSVLGRDLSAGLSAQQWRALRCEQGQIMQGLHLVARLSALENVLIGALGRLRGVHAWRGWLRCYTAADVQRGRDALHAVGMLSRAATRADRLSGGERQKVAIARLLMQGPRLILADEPTAALDPAAAADVCALLARAAHNATLISVVHNPALLPLLADRVIGLAQGRIAFDLALADLADERLMQLYRPAGHHAQSLVEQAQPHC